jgi:hypothetical protein
MQDSGNNACRIVETTEIAWFHSDCNPGLDSSQLQLGDHKPDLDSSLHLTELRALTGKENESASCKLHRLAIFERTTQNNRKNGIVEFCSFCIL